MLDDLTLTHWLVLVPRLPCHRAFLPHLEACIPVHLLHSSITHIFYFYGVYFLFVDTPIAVVAVAGFRPPPISHSHTNIPHHTAPHHIPYHTIPLNRTICTRVDLCQAHFSYGFLFILGIAYHSLPTWGTWSKGTVDGSTHHGFFFGFHAPVHSFRMHIYIYDLCLIYSWDEIEIQREQPPGACLFFWLIFLRGL